MNDSDLDALLRDHLESSRPRPELVRALVTPARRRRFDRRVAALALAAAAVLTVMIALPSRVSVDSDEASTAATNPAEPQVTVSLPAGLATVPGIPVPGDTVAVLLTVTAADGTPETVVLGERGGVGKVVGLDPLGVATSPEMAERLVHGFPGAVAVGYAVLREGRWWVPIARVDPLPVSARDRVDVLVSYDEQGFGRATRTLLSDAEVGAAATGRFVVLVLDDLHSVSALAHGLAVGELTLALRGGGP